MILLTIILLLGMPYVTQISCMLLSSKFYRPGNNPWKIGTIQNNFTTNMYCCGLRRITKTDRSCSESDFQKLTNFETQVDTVPYNGKDCENAMLKEKIIVFGKLHRTEKNKYNYVQKYKIIECDGFSSKYQEFDYELGLFSYTGYVDVLTNKITTEQGLNCMYSNALCAYKDTTCYWNDTNTEPFKAKPEQNVERKCTFDNGTTYLVVKNMDNNSIYTLMLLQTFHKRYNLEYYKTYLPGIVVEHNMAYNDDFSSSEKDKCYDVMFQEGVNQNTESYTEKEKTQKHMSIANRNNFKDCKDAKPNVIQDESNFTEFAYTNFINSYNTPENNYKILEDDIDFVLKVLEILQYLCYFCCVTYSVYLLVSLYNCFINYRTIKNFEFVYLFQGSINKMLIDKIITTESKLELIRKSEDNHFVLNTYYKN